MTDLLLDALSVYRLTKLAVDDAIFDTQRNAFVDRMKAAEHDKLAYLATCYWCTSVSIGFAVVVARRLFPRLWSYCARALAFSAAAGILSER